MLTASELDEHMYEAVRLGVAGYLLMSLDANELFDLLEGVAQGEAALTRVMACAGYTFHPREIQARMGHDTLYGHHKILDPPEPMRSC